MADRQHLEAAIAAQEGLRGVVPDEVVDAAVAALRHQLTDLDAGRPQRRVVTALFADVSGFTALSETLDAEVLAGVMNDLWNRLDGEISRLGGRVDKHMGDSVMALWGADMAKEDDVERAVRAGLALQDALADFRDETGWPVAMRVGINTGPALVGAVGSAAESTAMGDAVNLASRLEHAAPVDAVLVSHNTYRHVRGVFDVEALAPLDVRGKSEPVRAYIVRRAKARAFRIPTRGIEGIETMTVGRQAEFARLQAAYESAAAGSPQLVVVVGEAGVGKSRLLFELESWIELRPEGVWLLQGRALPMRHGVALGLLRDVLARRFGVLDSDAPTELAAKLRAGFAGALSSVEADVVGHWLGFDVRSPESVQGDRLDTVARAHLAGWLGWLARDEPTVLLLEDLHWADDESLAVIADLIARLPKARLLVVGLTRPDLADHAPAWLDGTITATRVDIEPLDAAATIQLVREVLRLADDPPDELVQLVANRSDGNPFFVEELVKMLIEQGVICTSGVDRAWTIDTAALDVNAVPVTLVGVLQARLDDLAVPEQAALQRAAVIGRVFWDAAVEALGDELGVGQALDAARSRELVFLRDESTFRGCAEYIFKHAILRDVTYETVLLRDRRRLHANAAQWLTAQAGERLSEYLDTIAEHYRAAGDPAAAADCFHRAARAALDRGLAGPARRSIEQALELWAQAGTVVPATAHVDLGDACRRLSDLDAAESALATALERASDSATTIRSLLHLGRVAFERGDQAAQRALVVRATALAETDDVATQAKVLVAMAWWEQRHGDINEAERLAERALIAVEQADAADDRFQANSVLGAVAASRGDLDAALAHVQVCLEIAQRSGDLSAEATAHHNLGVTRHLQGDATGDPTRYHEAIEHYEAEHAARRQLGDRIEVASSQLNQAQARLRLGDLEQAHAKAIEALATAQAIGTLRLLLFALLVEADVQLTAGAADVALPLLGVVHSHPEADRNDQEEIERIAARAALDEATVDAGLAAGAALDFDEVIAELLAAHPPS